MHELRSSPLMLEKVHFKNVDPTIERVHTAVGVRRDRPAHRRWLPVVDQFVEDTRRLVRARGLFRIDKVRSLETRRLELSSGAVYEGAVGRFLKHSEFVATYVLTIGSAMERLARRWMKGTKIMNGAIVDAIASEVTESAADQLQMRIQAWAAERQMGITPRYSPGYCGMDVRQQRPLFSTLPTGDIGVSINDSCLMTPIKSVSGLIGIAPADKVRPNAFPCETCNHPNCMQRRSAYDKRNDEVFDWENEDSAPDAI